MDPMPLAGVFSRTKAEASDAEKYPLTWVQCSQCSLVQVLEDIDDAVLYSTYNYASSTVGGLDNHFERYAETLVSRFGRDGVRVLEIGCNDGILLRRLPETWHRVGVDPSDVALRASASASYELVNSSFGGNVARELVASGKKFDVVTGSNCLAHISNLHDVFEGVARVLRPGGHFIIEVHDLEATIHGGQWDTIYHEHKAEWSIHALRSCLSPIGFELVQDERLPLHGGLLRASFQFTGKTKSASFEGDRLESGLRSLATAYERRKATVLYQTLADAFATKKRVSAYGAAGRANVWLNQHSELVFESIADESPLRAGKWIPGVATPVISRDAFAGSLPDVCLITAWNYASAIKQKFPSYHGRWLQTFGG